MTQNQEYYHAYYLAHQEHRQAYNLAHKDQNRLWQIKYYQDHKEQIHAYYLTNRERIKKYDKEYNKSLKIKAFTIIGGLQCVYCGCTILDALEVNHKNGGGKTELRSRRNMLHKIISGKRDTLDLEVVCRPCNAWHYLQRKGLAYWNVEEKQWKWR